MLDAIIEPEWEYRYYLFNEKWDVDEQMASMRNGQGDEWFCVFSKVGAFLKGFDHESQVSPWNAALSSVWPGILEQVPAPFAPFATEPAFSMKDTTFCIWRSHADETWHTGPVQYPDGEDPDGSEWMLAILEGNPRDYQLWAEGYYERPVNSEAVQHVYDHQPLSVDIVRILNPERSLEDMAKDIEQIGYPASDL